MEQPYIQDLRQPNIKSSITATMPAMTYMNDTIWLAKSKVQMETISTIVSSFVQMTGIKINIDKMNLLIINPSKNILQQVQFDDQIIESLKHNKPIRYLRVWLEANGKKTYQLQLIKKKLNFIIYNLKYSIIMGKQMYYIISAVLLPQITYLTLDFILSDIICETS